MKKFFKHPLENILEFFNGEFHNALFNTSLSFRVQD